ncbi:MAG: hypothetical protein J2O49_07125, partial [Sciscionella sp.]|nr:hypothetical protein [Sciscionella sp.]
MPANTPTDAPSAGQSKTPAGQLNVHDPNPPQPFRTPADEVKQLVTETDAGGLRLRRRPDRPPVVTVHD